MLIAIRADASSTTGLGHVKRCLSLAHALRALGAGVRFGVRRSDVDVAALVAAEGFATDVLEGDLAGDPARDAAAFCDALADTRPAWVVVDSYALDARWHAAVRARLGCRVAAIDDLADRALDVDALVDHNFVPAPGHAARYAAVLAREPALRLCGPRFALLGAAYAARAPFAVAPRVRSIGIFLGGTDPAGLSLVALDACRRVAGFDGPVEIASTAANPRVATLAAAAADDARLTVTLDQPDLAAFHARHDLQVGAGGGASWERACVGVPTLALCVAANQRAVIPALAGLGVLATVGDNTADAVGAAVAALVPDADARAAMSAAGRALVDGQGAPRVALALLAAAGALALRRVAAHGEHGEHDARTLWRWRNDPATRAVSRSAQDIPFEAHAQWLARTLADPARRLSIATIGGRDVGVIRFDRLASAWEVSLYLDPALHGLGLGGALLAAGEADLAALAGPQGDVLVHAEVLPDNAASRRLFLAAGYAAAGPNAFSKSLAPASAAGAASAFASVSAPAESTR